MNTQFVPNTHTDNNRFAERTCENQRPTAERRVPIVGHGRSVMLAVALIITLLFSACSMPLGGGDVDSAADSSSSQSTSAQSTGSIRAVVDSTDGADVVVYDSPNGSSMTTVPAVTTYGTTRVFLVDTMAGDWVRVKLPMRPNHQSGWIPATEVTLEEVEPVVQVDLEARTLTVVADDSVIAQATVAIGSPENPTPRGTFYITDKLETPDPQGAYGPYAFGLSGYSETLSEFGGGDGQIGIHGTNAPDLLGQAVSHGCVRLPNEVIGWLADLLPLGTPVHIV